MKLAEICCESLAFEEKLLIFVVLIFIEFDIFIFLGDNFIPSSSIDSRMFHDFS